MHQAKILPLATKDIQEAANWYNNRNHGLGRKFTNCVRKSIGFIKSNPEAIAVRYENIRTVPIETFPYLIHYYIEMETNSIVIVAVLHTSQDPEIWKRK